jgi:hypothetical protein
MDKRATKRIKTHQLARVAGKLGVVKNVSDDGLQVATGVLPKSRKIDISLELNGEEVIIKGIVQWFRRKSSLQDLNELGVRVKEAPPQYQHFVAKLTTD